MTSLTRRTLMLNTSKIAVGAALTSTALGFANTAEASVSNGAAYNAVRAAASRRGAPYRYGAAGPSAFDCSGLTSWSYRQVGRSIPRTAQGQYLSSYRIARASARPGDLTFLTSGNYAYHAGIYAGNGMMWHAPKPGYRVCLVPVTSSHRFGRI